MAENSNRDQLKVRVPKGTGSFLEEYVRTKAETDAQDVRYSATNGKTFRPSMSAYIQYLIEKELDVKLTELPDDLGEIRQMARKIAEEI